MVVDVAVSRERSLKAGLKLTSPEKGEEVVITGMAGRFPDSDDIHEFRDNLFNKVDLVTCDNRRWEPTHPEIPQRTGKINLVEKFDAGFFGVHQRQAHTMDPMCRILIERAFEAVLDAGIHPDELKGTNTGVFVGACFSETEKSSFYEKLGHQNYGIAGCTRSMLAQRISYWFQLQGPSYVSDTACSSSLFAVEHAYKALREGKCTTAIVGGCNLCLHPVVSLQFARLGVLSIDGACKSFDNLANGYARSEAVSAIILQKSKDAKRIYAEILHSKTNCDGFKEQGITYPSGKIQRVLLDEFYEECGVPPNSLTFVEAHGTGTKVGDPEELGTLDEVFCTGRNRPLHIGSVKSNIGHNEPVSGLCSIVKVVIGMETGWIPPNMHYKTARSGVAALETGRMKVVGDKTLLPDNNGLIGINSFGFGGANSHLLLRWNKKIKINRGLPRDDLPRLVCLSGRTEEAINYIINDFVNRSLDSEFVKLAHECFKKQIDGHFYRGYAILDKNSDNQSNYIHFNGELKPIYYVFGGLDKFWPQYSSFLFMLPIFAAHVQKIHNIFQSKNLKINIMDIITNYKIEEVEHQIVGNVALQTGLVDIMKLLDIKADGIIGYSLGEISAAYADGFLSLEQAMLTSYYTSMALKTTNSGVVLLKYLKEVIPIAKKSSRNWSPIQGKIGAEYFATTLLKQLALKQTNISIPKDVIVIEFGNAGVREAVQKNGNVLAVRLLEENTGDVKDLLEGLGRLYQLGCNFDLSKLYPVIKYPVSRGTPMLSPLIKWDHSKDWYVTFYKVQDKTKTGHRVIEAGLRDDDWQFVRGHIIDGRQLFPAAGYVNLVWETLAMMVGKLTSDMKIILDNVKFIRACTVPSKGRLELIIMIQKGTGNFEIVEGGSAVVTGQICENENLIEEWTDLPIPASANKQEVKLNSKDIYKELRLRGYNYKEQFKAVKECDLEATSGKISWDGNWIPFMDNMLQLQILQEDTRNLYVPTRIDKVIVDAKDHIRCAKILGDEPQLPVYLYKDLNIIRSGGIEIRGLWANSIVRKKQAEAVLETYKFMPNIGEFDVTNSIRILTQLALENTAATKIKAVELIDEETTETECLASYILEALADQPLVQPEISVISKNPIEIPGITVEDKKISMESDCYFVIGSKILERKELRSLLFTTLRKSGFMISRESLHYYPERVLYDDVDILAIHLTPKEKLVLIKSKIKEKQNCKIIEVNDEFNIWLPNLQEAIKSSSNNVLLYSTDEFSGILGLTNCIRREPNGDKVKCFYILDRAPAFDLENPFYKSQLLKGLAVNIFKDGKWGSYRHLVLQKASEIRTEHCYVNVTTRGDLSSLRWIEGPLRSDSILAPERILVKVYCAAINFRDIMTASGRIQSDVITRNRLEQDCVQGFEFSGRDPDGRRVMGLLTRNAMATLVAADTNLLWQIPDKWSMEEAVTIPAVYGTVLYGFILRAGLKFGQSVLIHSATGGVGQAAIHVALHYNCTIYVTVGTEEKKDFIRRNFPQIRPENIGCSRDTSFEQMIFKRTQDRGVDLVLNSLADDKLQASIRCLANGGSFVEIGKFDLASDTALNLDLIKKGATFHGVMLDALFVSDPTTKRQVTDLLELGIKQGYIKPLPRTCFKSGEIEQAFRFMATGKHIGKVMVRVRKESDVPEVVPRKFTAIPRFSCDPYASYVILGGLGGFGLELADWLILRGARKLVLTSRKGVTTGYQTLRINTWKKYGATIKTLNYDATNLKSVEELLQASNELGSVAGIFNLAVVLKDGLIENQTVDTFQISCNPKALACKFLDQISRKLCPNLKQFVVFSSVSCGRGNAGQTNYGYSNSVMERICENRRNNGLPALAIQWGAIGDVGLVAELQEEQMELVIGGTLQQRISSCLDCLDGFLRQGEAIVGSMVVAEKKSGVDGADNMVDAVVNILGLRDLKTVSLHSTFPELGMDSMMAVEIKQTLEREYEVFLTPQDIRSMTFSRLQEISQKTPTDDNEKSEDLPKGVKLLLRFIASEEESNIPLVELPSLLRPEEQGPTVFLLPGIEGMATVFQPLVKNLKAHPICLQFCYENTEATINEMATNLYKTIASKVSENFILIAHSFGAAIALELASILESKQIKVFIILLDGAPALMKYLIETQLEVANEAEFQTSLLCTLMSVYIPFEIISNYKVSLLNCSSYEERIKFVLGVAPKNIPHSHQYLEKVCLAAYSRMKAIYNYKTSFVKLVSNIVLYRPTNSSVLDIEEDYQVQEFTSGNVVVKFIEGDHVSILENVDLAAEINSLLGGEVGSGKHCDVQQHAEVIKHGIA